LLDKSCNSQKHSFCYVSKVYTHHLVDVPARYQTHIAQRTREIHGSFIILDLIGGCNPTYKSNY
jgi:hypothetical protein